jgi:hypothetical protein
MSDLKTQPTAARVADFLAAIPDEARRADCQALAVLMERATGAPPTMWGASIIGFGRYHYRYASGREGDWFLTGFAPRKSDLTLYIMVGFDGYEPLLARLGRHKTGKSCLYVKRLADLDLAALEELVTASVRQLRATYPN